MPIYGYHCSNCEHDFDLSKKIADRDETSLDICPSCSEVGQITRQVGSPLVAYSIATAGYGRGAGDGWKEVLNKIHSAPGAKSGYSSFT